MDGRTRIIRIIAVAVCLSAALSLSGCATAEAITSGSGFGEIMDALRCDLFGSEQQNCIPLQLTLPIREGFKPIESKSAYASLRDETLKEAYRDIENSLFQVSSDRADNGCFELKYTRLKSSLDLNEIFIVKQAVLADHPEAFWVTGSYTVKSNFHDGRYIVLYSKYSADEIVAMFDELNNALIPILSRIPDDADELTRETVIHDALVDEISYDFEAAETDDSTHYAFNIYGALVKKKALCTGYAGSMKLLMNLVGIECRTAVGTSKNSGHMWNQIRIDGDWYNLDVTWDDYSTDSDILYRRYNYFNITDERLAVNHNTGADYSEMKYVYTEDKGYVTTELYNFDLEECTSVKCNYYEMYALHLSSLSDASADIITQKFISSSRERKELIYIIFDDSIKAEDAEAWLSKNSGTRYSALGRSISASNQAENTTKIRNCNLVRLSSGDNNIWNNLYAVRLIYA